MAPGGDGMVQAEAKVWLGEVRPVHCCGGCGARTESWVLVLLLFRACVAGVFHFGCDGLRVFSGGESLLWLGAVAGFCGPSLVVLAVVLVGLCTASVVCRWWWSSCLVGSVV